ncbi:MAG: CTP synthase, partial [Thermoplasmata archaeon]
LGLEKRECRMHEWKRFVEEVKSFSEPVKIGIVGKYFDIGSCKLFDSYISVIEAIKHAAWANRLKPEIAWIDSKTFEKYPEKLKELSDLDGVIVPGGFGLTGIEGKIRAIKYCREHNIPFLGLCLGMQLAVVEFARNVCNLKDANSVEIDENTPHPVVSFIPEQVKILHESRYGATMRLGAYPARLKKGTLVYRLYGKDIVYERHRHRYEVNPDYVDVLEKGGIVFSGKSLDGLLMEFMELPDHKFFVATQAHPEFKSRPMKPSPLFNGLIKAARR